MESNRKRRRQIAGYVTLLAVCFVVGIVAGWTSFAARVDNYAYDLLFRAYPPNPWPTQSVVLAIDEDTLAARGGPPRLRGIVADGLEKLAEIQLKAVALDVLLPDQSDEREDERLERALARLHTLVLPCEPVRNHWEDPLPRFRKYASAVGHVLSDQGRLDGVSRQLPLEAVVADQRRWALSLEAFRLTETPPRILESPDDLQVGNTNIPAARNTGRMMLIRFLAAGIPMVSLKDLLAKPELGEQLRGKVVFFGVTALSLSHDRLVNPYGDFVPGVEVHAQAFETMSSGHFLTPADNLVMLGLCLALAGAAGLTFWFRSGWQAYLIGAALLATAHSLPVFFFRAGVVSPYFAPVSVAWLAVVGAASYRYFVVQRELRRSESEKVRYQQAIHFVAHEMRTPLTAIQGSSELMTRYTLNEDKRQQIAKMINSESKRLARMIQTFLDVERLSDGQMELKREPFQARDLVGACVERVRPVAERKKIQLHVEEPITGALTGDRELMEYALYNLLTNAVKYSPAETNVYIASSAGGDQLRLSVRDEGMGMDAKELRQIFRKFYRTKRAEQSGEAGTGIGLSIVDQIVMHHGGRMEVTSKPGKGSCFTMVFKAGATVESTSR